jgi:hypothetical protein
MRNEMSASAVLLKLGCLEVDAVSPDLNTGTKEENKKYKAKQSKMCQIHTAYSPAYLSIYTPQVNVTGSAHFHQCCHSQRSVQC